MWRTFLKSCRRWCCLSSDGNMKIPERIWILVQDVPTFLQRSLIYYFTKHCYGKLFLMQQCYIRNDLSYNIISVFLREIESVFFEILLPNSKPITIGTIYRQPNQSNFLEILNENMNKIDLISNEIYILGNFRINLSLNYSRIFSNKSMLNNKSISSDVKSYY